MGKKSADGPIVGTRRAQVSVFIILGIVILFTFLFVFQLSSGIKKNQMEQQQEKILTKSFGKEALRLYVEDCLKDGLEQGLVLIGKQGRIWADQAGGTKHFEEGITGVTYDNEEGGRIAYGITRRDIPLHQNAYPCLDDTKNPAFCQYRYPNTTLGFGILQYKQSNIKTDLQRFLENKTISCVTQFVKNNISTLAELDQTDMKLNMNLADDTIGVEVNYPLRFHVGNENYFDLTQFDFTYSSKFNQLLKSAIQIPLEDDFKYLDFKYDPATLEAGKFTYANTQLFPGCSGPVQGAGYYSCIENLALNQYTGLGIHFTKEQVHGDTIFTFSPALGSIINTPIPYEFRIARQNRPPALNYINRSQCITGDSNTDYDYLVIQHDPVYGQINISASALDPDEEEVSYTFERNNIHPLPLGVTSSSTYNVTDTEINNLEPGKYQVKVVASDHVGSDQNQQDWQDVRVLVDAPIDTSLTLNYNYQFSDGHDGLVAYNTAITNGPYTHGKYIVSAEDPLFLNLAIPSRRTIPTSAEDVTLTYTHDGHEDPIFSLPHFNFDRAQSCYVLPYAAEAVNSCSLNLFNTDDDIIKIKDLHKFSFNPFNAHQLSAQGTLRLNYNVNYCAATVEHSVSSADVIIKQCMPHLNPSHPFAYPYDKITVDPATGIRQKDTSLESPFEATHSCCAGDITGPGSWGLRPSGSICFESPTPQCKGRMTEYSGNLAVYEGYILEQKIDRCDGTRGNICGSSTSNEARLWQENKHEVLRCGDPHIDTSCTKVVSGCENSLAWGFIDVNKVNKANKDITHDITHDITNEGWCHGTMGCQQVCTSQIVSESGSPVVSSTFLYDMNLEAQRRKITHDEDLKVHCSCTQEDATNHRLCDANFDGRFEGKCLSPGVCG